MNLQTDTVISDLAEWFAMTRFLLSVDLPAHARTRRDPWHPLQGSTAAGHRLSPQSGHPGSEYMTLILQFV